MSADARDGDSEPEAGVFEPLIGHPGAKAILRSALQRADVHLLLSGPPASGKSVALLAIEDAIEGAEYVDARGFTERKLRDTLAENPPVLLVDEFDNMKQDAFKALNTALEQGRVTKNVTGDSYDKEITTQVFAACNYPDELPGDVADRFVSVDFDPYSRDEYLEVCGVLLPEQVEWVTETPNPDETAREIARVVWDNTDSRSPRTARDAAMLASEPQRVPAIIKAMNNAKADVESEPVYADELPHNDRETDESGSRPKSLEEVRQNMADPDNVESRDVSEINDLFGGGDDDDAEQPTEETSDPEPEPTTDDGADETESDNTDLDLDVGGPSSGREYIDQMVETGNRVIPVSSPEQTVVGLLFPEDFSDELLELSQNWKVDPSAADLVAHEPATIREEFGEEVSGDLKTIQFHATDPEDIRSTGYDIDSIVEAIADHDSILITVSGTLRWQPDL